MKTPSRSLDFYQPTFALIAALFAALIALCPGQMRADTIALNFTSSGNTFLSGAGDDTLGWSFSLTSSVTVTQLGVWDNGGNGLIQPHQITIWDSTGTVIEATALVPSGTAATLTNGFRYVALGSSVLLGPGTYTIGAYFAPFGDDAAILASAVAGTSPVTYTGSRSETGNAYPAGDAFSLSNSYFGPNFQFTVSSVPDRGSTLGLFVLALGALFAATRLRSLRSA